MAKSKNRFLSAALENIVFQTLAKQFRISDNEPNYVASFLGYMLTKEEYRRLRRGVRWVLTHGSFGMLKISDEKLKDILGKYNIRVKGD